MGLMDKISNFLTGEEEAEYVNEGPTVEEPVVDTPAPSTPRVSRRTSSVSADTKMVLFEPRGFSEVEEVGRSLVDGRAVVVNLHKLDREYAQRTIDFLTGVVFALSGKIQKIGQNVILCSPASIGVQGQISLGEPDAFDEE